MKQRYGFLRMAAIALVMACLMAACGAKAPGRVSGKGESLRLMEGGGMEYQNEELGFVVGLPELFVDHLTVESDARQAYGEKIHVIWMNYEGEGGPTPVLQIAEMSKEVWELAQREEGPSLGTELGESPAGRVVIYSSLQSNPFREGTEDFEKFQTYPKQLSQALEHFSFLEEK